MKQFIILPKDCTAYQKTYKGGGVGVPCTEAFCATDLGSTPGPGPFAACHSPSLSSRFLSPLQLTKKNTSSSHYATQGYTTKLKFGNTMLTEPTVINMDIGINM